MARRIVALVLGLTVLGLVSTLVFFMKESGVEVERAGDGAGQAASLPVRIVAAQDGRVLVDGRPVELAELADEVGRIIAAAEAASLPEPSFVIAAARDADNTVLITIMEALSEAGAGTPAIEALPED